MRCACLLSSFCAALGALSVPLLTPRLAHAEEAAPALRSWAEVKACPDPGACPSWRREGAIRWSARGGGGYSDAAGAENLSARVEGEAWVTEWVGLGLASGVFVVDMPPAESEARTSQTDAVTFIGPQLALRSGARGGYLWLGLGLAAGFYNTEELGYCTWTEGSCSHEQRSGLTAHGGLSLGFLLHPGPVELGVVWRGEASGAGLAGMTLGLAIGAVGRAERDSVD